MHTQPLDRVLEDHRPQLCALVRALRPDLRPDATDAEVIVSALPGLRDAHRRYDPARGPNFWKYAYLRIRGGILDASDDDRRRRRRGRLCRTAAVLLAHEDEIAPEAPDHEAPELRVIRVDAKSPEEAFADAEALARLTAEVERLPHVERVVVRGIYFEHRCLDDLAAEVGGISRAWASRIHTRAIGRLRERIHGVTHP